jgi:hypothetical protein
MITRENDRPRFKTGQRTISGADFVITTSPTGLYIIEVEGKGDKPNICAERFTSLRFAKLALDKYEMDNAATIAKKASIDEGIERRKKAAKE